MLIMFKGFELELSTRAYLRIGKLEMFLERAICKPKGVLEVFREGAGTVRVLTLGRELLISRCL